MKYINPAKKAWEARRKKYSKREISNRSRESAKKAWQTIRNSEREFLIKEGITENKVISHNGKGLPDFFCIKDNELIFYEIKPKKGPEQQIKLNNYQTSTVKKILETNIAKVYLVRYKKMDSGFQYEKKLLSLKDLSDYSFSGK